MRKAEREIRDPERIRAIMEEARVCRLGMCDGREPYVVPLNYGLGENCLYLHCAREGRKIEILRANDRVCFEMDLLREVKRAATACGWSARFESVIGSGRALFVEDPAEKRRGLDRIMAHYAGEAGPFDYGPKNLERVQVLRIDIASVTGKEHE
jgi:uncharacterized protein